MQRLEFLAAFFGSGPIPPLPTTSFTPVCSINYVQNFPYAYWLSDRRKPSPIVAVFAHDGASVENRFAVEIVGIGRFSSIKRR